jgi:hypothetical protein
MQTGDCREMNRSIMQPRQSHPLLLPSRMPECQSGQQNASEVRVAIIYSGGRKTDGGGHFASPQRSFSRSLVPKTVPFISSCDISQFLLWSKLFMIFRYSIFTCFERSLFALTKGECLEGARGCMRGCDNSPSRPRS